MAPSPQQAVAALHLNMCLEKRRLAQKRLWMRSWLAIREKKSVYHRLLRFTSSEVNCWRCLANLSRERRCLATPTRLVGLSSTYSPCLGGLSSFSSSSHATRSSAESNRGCSANSLARRKSYSECKSVAVTSREM